MSFMVPTWCGCTKTNRNGCRAVRREKLGVRPAHSSESRLGLLRDSLMTTSTRTARCHLDHGLEGLAAVEGRLKEVPQLPRHRLLIADAGHLHTVNTVSNTFRTQLNF
jgi:hypothetical protein